MRNMVGRRKGNNTRGMRGIPGFCRGGLISMYPTLHTKFSKRGVSPVGDVN